MEDLEHQAEMEARRIDVLGVLEERQRDLDNEVNKLRRWTKKEVDRNIMFSLEECLLNVYDQSQVVHQRILEWEDILDQDEEGDTIFLQEENPELDMLQITKLSKPRKQKLMNH